MGVDARWTHTSAVHSLHFPTKMWPSLPQALAAIRPGVASLELVTLRRSTERRVTVFLNQEG